MNSKKEIIDSFKDRLSIIIKYYALEKRQLAEVGAISASSVTKYLKGESAPSQDTLALWAFALGFNLNWLLLNEGEMLRSAQQSSNADSELTMLRQRVSDLEGRVADKEEMLELYREKLAEVSCGSTMHPQSASGAK